MKKGLFIIFILSSIFASAQFSRKIRHEWVAGLGTTSFLGDLGGRNQIGTNDIRDLDAASTRMAASIGLRYKNHQRISVRAFATYALLSGSDKNTTEKFRQNRNLNFRSSVYELGFLGEYWILRERGSRLYTITGLKASKKNKGFGLYVFGGVEGFFFNTKGLVNNKWVGLYKLHTEGQGLDGGPKQYSRLQFALPFGVGFKYTFDKMWSIGADLGYRKTFTDYIDDVSTYYYDNAAIVKAYGTNAGLAADPSLGNVPLQIDSNTGKTRAGLQRGDKNKDSYFMFQVTVGRKFKRKNNVRTRAKF